MTRFRALGVLIALACTLPASAAHSTNYPCSGKKGGVDRCAGTKFICRDGTASGSKKVCTKDLADTYRQQWDIDNGKLLEDEDPPTQSESLQLIPGPVSLTIVVTVPPGATAAMPPALLTGSTSSAPESPAPDRLADMSTSSAAIAITMQVILLAAHDGDTISVQADGRLETVRIQNIDTPEMPPLAKCDAEAVAARGARDALIALAPLGTDLTLKVGDRQRDKYGRLLAAVILPNGADLGEQLIAKGYARPWRGHREAWCTVGGDAVFDATKPSAK